jgi:hypothetical protein
MMGAGVEHPVALNGTELLNGIADRGNRNMSRREPYVVRPRRLRRRAAR